MGQAPANLRSRNEALLARTEGWQLGTTPPLVRRFVRRWRRMAVGGLVLGSLAACSATPDLVVGIPRQAEAYLLSPLLDYPAQALPAYDPQLETGYQDLLRGEVVKATAVAQSILREAPTYPPALLLSAQVDFLAQRYSVVVSRLQEVLVELPDYTPLQLLVARSAELSGDVVLAYLSYRRLPDAVARATPRAADLYARVIETLRIRVEDALAHGLQDQAEEDLALLKTWAPDEPTTLDSWRQVAEARGDLEEELQAIVALVDTGAGGRPLLERWAELELRVGEPFRGLEIYRQLVDRFPQDPVLAEKLAAANFRRRLRLLPQEVQELAEDVELNRAQFAKLLFWLVPGIRYAEVTGARIATDILDQAQRDEIVRIVNLGLMDVDETLHRFEPKRKMRRAEALVSLLRIPARLTPAHTGQSVLSCLTPDPGGRSGPVTVCDFALRCGLISDEASCRPREPLLGIDAQEWIRRTLDLLQEP